MTDELDLSPCPFCREEGGHIVRCVECEADAEETRTPTPAAPQTGYSWTNSAPQDAPETLTMRYKNYRGEVSIRTITPTYICWSSTKWHPEKGWLLYAFDHGKQAERAFALADADFADLPEARIAALQAERDEDANQLDSARHTVDVLTARIAELEAALTEIASLSHTKDLLWWQKIARQALKIKGTRK